MNSVETAGIRAEQESRRFEMELRRFTDLHGPRKDSYEMFEFQRDLLHLMRAAMTSQRETMGLGIETYASSIWAERAIRPVYAATAPQTSPQQQAVMDMLAISRELKEEKP